MERLERRVEDLINLWMEERNKRIEDKRLLWTALETRRWIGANTNYRKEGDHTEAQGQQQQSETSEENQGAGDGSQQEDTEEDGEEEVMRKILEKLGKGELDFEMRERLERKNNAYIKKS